ncbi:hypothetical protein KSD_32400 [Ktedonobacter sp. SOSP1-85]|uniref:hypothetical protein n=1 Tax=Ktedonobacter sp. SOSP1-85 TaxID=2778367 RepID=UPI001915496A|nr:hypothetical protein [Ktedonobacter sp. SOSP1-85]GHO75469.1 hypothetical protein KSD_32400 [Ktedonobacter sp. SOSP1-85]
MQEHKDEPLYEGQQEPGGELSATWQELLGKRGDGIDGEQGKEPFEVPVLSSDPWSELLQTRGNEELDLQQIHLDMSAQDLERALQLMQEDGKKAQKGAFPSADAQVSDLEEGEESSS